MYMCTNISNADVSLWANKNDINYIDNSDSDVGYIHCPECKNYIRGDAYFIKTNSQYRAFNKKI